MYTRKIDIEIVKSNKFITLLLISKSKTMTSAESDRQIVSRIELAAFSNAMALSMGIEIIKLARSRNQAIAVEIARLNHTIFLFIDDCLAKDKQNWLRRKANVAKQFEESSLVVKNDLLKGNMNLKTTFGLDENDFLAKGGAIPIFVKNAGLIATITVSGLSDEGDHNIIVEALNGKF